MNDSSNGPRLLEEEKPFHQLLEVRRLGRRWAFITTAGREVVQL